MHSLMGQEAKKNEMEILSDDVTLRINHFNIRRSKSTPDDPRRPDYRIGGILDYRKTIWKGAFVVASNSYDFYYNNSLNTTFKRKTFNQRYTIGAGLGWKQKIKHNQSLIFMSTFSRAYVKMKREDLRIPQVTEASLTDEILTFDLGYMVNIKQRHGIYVSVRRDISDQGITIGTLEFDDAIGFSLGYVYHLNTL